MAKPARIAIIPARGGSKRIKDKNILQFAGKPMIGYSLDTAQRSRLFDVIHVSTDDERIERTAARLGHRPEFRRPTELADDRTPLMPVLRWTLEEYARRGRSFSEVCLLMAAAPLIEATDLRAAHRLFAQHRSENPVIAVTPFPVPPAWALTRDEEGWVTFAEPSAVTARSQDLGRAYFDTGLFAFFSAASVLAGAAQQTRYLSYVLPREKAVDIDEPEDLAFAQALLLGRRRADS